MVAKLKEKKVARETKVMINEKGKERNLIVIIEPKGTIGFRLKGMKSTYYLSMEALYKKAVEEGVQ